MSQKYDEYLEKHRQAVKKAYLRLNLGSYFLCKGENNACQRSDKSGYSGCL